MKWVYSISAVSAPRLLTRVVMIFDQQSLTLSEVSWRLNDGDATVEISLRVACPEALAQRMHAKLLHLQDLRMATLSADEERPSA
jgi:hypothetical protein